MRKIFDKLRELVPVGVELESELKYMVIGYVISFLYSLTYFISLNSRIQELYIRPVKILIKDVEMPYFADFGPRFTVLFAAMAVGMIFVIAYHYIYHFQGSKSVYTMRRLPQKGEFVRRCAALPLLCAAICLMTAGVLIMIFLGVYMITVPGECLKTGQLNMLFKTIFGGALC